MSDLLELVSVAAQHQDCRLMVQGKVNIYPRVQEIENFIYNME